MLSAVEVRAMNIKIVVDDPEWQVLRKSLIGNWMQNHRINVAALDKYFMDNMENPLAIRRLVNVLTGSVHRTGKTKNQPETDDLRRRVRIQWKVLLGEGYDVTDPKYVTGEI